MTAKEEQEIIEAQKLGASWIREARERFKPPVAAFAVVEAICALTYESARDGAPEEVFDEAWAWLGKIAKDRFLAVSAALRARGPQA